MIRVFKQNKGVDYVHSYSHLTKITIIRDLIALASIHDLVVHQMDVKTSFLNGDLKEEIYTTQPEGFVVPGQEDTICKLRKSLYELKEELKQLNKKFTITLVDNNFVVNSSDTCVYSKMIGSDCVIICLYVDDMLIFGPNVNVINETINLK